MEKLIYTWEQQIDDTNLICAKIEADGFKPDVIVGISRGGLIPGVMISHKLNIPFKPVHASTSSCSDASTPNFEPQNSRFQRFYQFLQSQRNLAKFREIHKT